MKNYILTFLLAVLVVLASVSLRNVITGNGSVSASEATFVAIGPSPAPFPPKVAIGPSPAPFPPKVAIGPSPAPFPPKVQ